MQNNEYKQMTTQINQLTCELKEEEIKNHELNTRLNDLYDFLFDVKLKIEKELSKIRVDKKFVFEEDEEPDEID